MYPGEAVELQDMERHFTTPGVRRRHPSTGPAGLRPSVRPPARYGRLAVNTSLFVKAGQREAKGQRSGQTGGLGWFIVYRCLFIDVYCISEWDALAACSFARTCCTR